MIILRRWVCQLRGHDYINHCEGIDVTPLLECRRCGHSGWLL